MVAISCHDTSATGPFEHRLPDGPAAEHALETVACGRCRVVMDAKVTVKLFGVATLVEPLLPRELPLHQERAIAWFNAHQRAR